jgi:L-cystine transport system permease protein
MASFFDVSLLWVYFGQIVKGLPVNIGLFLIITSLAVILGLISGMVRLKHIPVLKQIFGFFIHYTRGTPMVIQLFIVYYGFPVLVNKFFGLNINTWNPMIYVVIAYALNSATFYSDAIRTAMISLGQNQLEAGLMCGLTSLQTYRRIIFPQAFFIAFPTISINACALVSDMALAYLVGISDVMGIATTLGKRTYHLLEAFIVAMLIMVLLNVLLQLGARLLEKRLENFRPKGKKKC